MLFDNNSEILMKPLSIIKNLILSACLIGIMAGCKPSGEKSFSIQAEIDSISAAFIPDPRMGIGDINVKEDDAGVLILTGETTDPHLRDALIKTLSDKGNRLIDSIIILPDTLLNKKYRGLATLSVINMRKQPEHSAEMVSQAVLGTPVRILKNKESWLLIQTPDQYLGWTESSSVEQMTIEEMAEWKESDRVITIVNSGWIYSATDESGVVGDFTAGCILVKTGYKQGYAKVGLPDGREGYISSRFLMDFNIWKTNVKCTGGSIVKSASSLLGLPYLWGGTSSRGVDCSGFSKTVYFLNGIILYRDASQQALHGMNVDITSDYSQMTPGDLLFFGTRENSKLRVTHVAIYTGDSEYINSSGRVQVNSLDSTRSNYNGYRKNLLLTARRIIGAGDDPGIVNVKSHPWY